MSREEEKREIETQREVWMTDPIKQYDLGEYSAAGTTNCRRINSSQQQWNAHTFD